MFEAKDVNFSYTEEKPIVRDFSLALEKKEKLAIVGKNGYGKSTLLKIMAGELAPLQGEVTFSEQTAIGYFGQTNIQRLKESSTIEEEIAAANTALNYTDVKKICGLMMFGGDASKKKIAVLSGGEKSRVLLGKILAKPCNLLLLDEPTHHLDIESIEALIDALEEFEGALVIVTHSELILKRLELSRLIICHQDRQEQFLGNYDEFLEKIGWEEEKTPPKKTSSDADVRKKKHEEKMAMRAKIRPLENEVRSVEKKIIDLEAQIARESEQLARASQNQDLEAIQKLSKSSSLLEKELQLLIERYMKLEEELSVLKNFEN